jgi:hypothetical protein
MKLNDVRDLLRQTIARKKEYRTALIRDQQRAAASSIAALIAQSQQTVIELLEINIAELERILADLDQCE